MGCNYLWDAITYYLQIHPTLYWACDYLSLLVLKVNYVSKRVPDEWGLYWLRYEITYCQISQSLVVEQKQVEIFLVVLASTDARATPLFVSLKKIYVTWLFQQREISFNGRRWRPKDRCMYRLNNHSIQKTSVTWAPFKKIRDPWWSIYVIRTFVFIVRLVFML